MASSTPLGPDPREATRLIHAGQVAEPLVKTVGPPIQKGSTVLLPDAASLYDDANYITYGRQGLSAQFALQSALAELENAEGVTLYPSGLAALTGALLAVLRAGDEVLVTDTIYKPSRRFCDKVLTRFGVKVSYFDPRTPAQVLVDGASDDVRLILMESPGSLSFEMQDVALVARLAKARGILTAADNTWGAGYLYKPLNHGVDISIQALTKYVGGHSDVFMGSVAARDPQTVRALADGVLNLGWSVSGDDACAPCPPDWRSMVEAAWRSPSGWRRGRRSCASSIPACRARPTMSFGRGTLPARAASSPLPCSPRRKRLSTPF